MSNPAPQPGTPPHQDKDDTDDQAGTHSDAALVVALRRRDEDAFVSLVSAYYSSMLNLALLYVPSHAVAEEVVQETWVAVLQGIDRFEGRSSLKTWLFRILTNIAKTRGQREGRTVPLSSLAEHDLERDEPAVDLARFLPPDHPQWPHHWLHAPQSWATVPEEHILSRETAEHIQQAIVALPPMQREVIRLRDIEGWSAEEVCNTLELSETNQRVLLHRSRSKVRASLERYFADK